MSILKRLSVTLFSRLDNVVSDIENHDAIIEAAIEEQAKKIANAKVQLLHLNRRKSSVLQQLKNANEERERWQQRALNEAKVNESKALECIRRRKNAEQQIEKLKQSESEYVTAAEKLSRDIQHSEEELTDIKQKRQLLKARESSAKVRSEFTPNANANLKQAEKAFDRWEANLMESPLEIEEALLVDDFEQAYQAEEKENELKEELAQLIRSDQERVKKENANE
ncbi:hypothetical protein FLL45_02235 [Aliikangiella marina]|uniref:PspA/IM30 family protein n=1 Tax=Aliikangiella marina TaxID=1712262 RepID=A0A545THX7_9GAMM|nr:PspA/IM30 family protein [Aliikangiella marina]TQV76796.1 hypothetical protein FLL45_02235 [Aliikangiella marina]